MVDVVDVPLISSFIFFHLMVNCFSSLLTIDSKASPEFSQQGFKVATDHVEFPCNREVDPEYPPAVLLQTNKTCPKVLDPLLVVTTELPSKTSGCDIFKFLQCV